MTTPSRPALTEVQRERYARHLRLPEVGESGQRTLLASAVRVRGCGRAAETATVYLVAAGVGRVIIEPKLFLRLAPRLARLNDDSGVTTAGTFDLAIDPAPADRRAAGAMSALGAVFALTRGGDGAPVVLGAATNLPLMWREDPIEVTRWHE